MLSDDALYRHRELPGDIDDPPESYEYHDHDEEGDCDCGCDSCSHNSEDYVTPKYALYSAIGDAIHVYDGMEDEEFGDETDDIIMKIAEEIRRIKK